MKRFWEVDALRGVAITMMLISNTMTDLNYFNIINTPLYGFWWWFARITASIFLTLVGVSLTLSYSRSKKPYKHYLQRGLKIFSYGLLISLVTYAFIPQDYIAFGVLHLIGVSIIISYPLIKRDKLALFLGMVVILLDLIVFDMTGSGWLLWLGIKPVQYRTVDYFPLIPWYGLILLGVYLGNQLYLNYKRAFKLKDRECRFLCWLGRHSLVIYLLHQPVIMSFLYLSGLV